MARAAGEGSETVSFRLAGPLLERLTAGAQAQGVSKGEYARQLAVAALQSEHELEVLRLLGQTRDDVRRLRTDLAGVLETALLNLTSASEEDVSELVAKVLKA